MIAAITPLVVAAILSGHALLFLGPQLAVRFEVAIIGALALWMLALGFITFGGISSGEHRVILLGAGSVLTILWANLLRYAWRQEYLRRTPQT